MGHLVEPIGHMLNLQQLGSGMPALSPARGIMMAECASVCFEDRSHATGVSLRVLGLADKEFSVLWDEVTEIHRRTYNDLEEATEHGAYGVAIVLLREITGKKVIDRAKKGPGFDYWIGDTDEDELIFSNKARLEVSGILSGTDSKIAARLRTKLDQVKPSDLSGYPAYVAIIEFGQPKARVELK